MKKLSICLFLIFFSLSASSYADNIQDFEIEGITIGGSLLDYMSEEEIKENVGYIYPDKKFTISVYKKFSEIYNWGVGVDYKWNDKTYKIHGVQGRIRYANNIEGCYKKQDEIEKKISSMFTETKKDNWGILKLHLKGEAAEESTYKPITYDFNDGATLMINCYYYHDDPPHMLKISMTSKELSEFVTSPAEPANN